MYQPLPSHFERIGELDAELERLGLGYVRNLGAEALLPFVPDRDRKALRYVLGRQRLTDFATTEGLSRYGFALAHAPRLREQLPPVAARFLEDEAQALIRARQELATRLQPPDDDRLHDLHAQLLSLRSAHPKGLPPRPGSALGRMHLSVDDALPGFRWIDPRMWIGPTGQVPVSVGVKLRLSPEAPSARCDRCEGFCLHTLAAVDAALLLLKSPADPSLHRLAEELPRPAWERALRAIDDALERTEQAQVETHVSWRLRVHRDDGVEVLPYLHKATRKGLSAGTRISASRLREDHDAQLSAQDRRIAELAARTFSYAGRPLLKALVGHPRVVLEDNPNATVRVDVARVGLLADDRAGSVVLVAALDGAPLPAGYLKRLLEERASGSPAFLFEEAARKLTVLELPDEVRATLTALQRFGNDFPPESHAALVEKLSRLSAKVPVAMPRSVAGEAIPPSPTCVLRLQPSGLGNVRGELRVRPLPESAAFIPADGPRDVHVRRDGKPLHAKRDFNAELALAQDLWPKLLGEEAVPDPEQPFGFDLPSAHLALTFLERLDALGEAKPHLEWLGQPMQVSARVSSGALKVQLEKKRDWFGATGGLAVDGERISLAVLLDAARREERFVKVKGNSYVEVSEALRRHLKALADHAWVSPHGVELGPSAVETLQALSRDDAQVDADATWRALSERIFAAKALTPRVPRALKATLRDYQREGFDWLSRLGAWGAGAVLADDMGLGKTVQALAVLLDRAKLGPSLVVAPTSVGFNWVDEAARFAPSLKLHVYAESPDRGATLERLGPKDVLVLSYGLLARDTERLSQVRFGTIVFDEAQAVKNAGTHRARAARMLQGDFRFALSGTPLENHLGELWSIFRIVFPGLLGSWDAFRDRFATPIEKKLDPTAAPALSRVLAPFLLRRTKAQVAKELPERTDLRVPVVLSPEEWQLYEDARLAALSELETPKPKLKEQQRRVEVLAALTRLRLLASHPRLYDRRSAVESSKLRRLVELVEELLSEGHRALIFSQFTSHLALVREAFDKRGFAHLSLEGSTPRAERERRVAAFQAGSAPLFLISLKAGGFGLNLTGADNVIHLDPWWNPAVEDQASDRAHRIGQHKPVTVYRLVAKGTIEEQILALHEEKRALVLDVLEGKDGAGRLSTKELLDLLSRPAERALADVEPASRARH